MRYDHSRSEYPEQQIGGTRFLPGITVFPARRGVEGYHDVSPRTGAVYDLFSTGKPALKFNAGRYLEAAVNASGNHSSPLPASVIRAELPEISASNSFCHNPPGVTTRVTDTGSNTIPRVDVLLSATFQSSSGSVLAANCRFTNAQ